MQNSHQLEVVRTLKGQVKRANAEHNIPIVKPDRAVIGWLVPITDMLTDDDEILESLTRWRQEHMGCFLTQFKATKARTRNWLKNTVISDDSRILFVITDENRQLIGNYGVCNICSESAELDNTIRGEKRGDRQLMLYAELALISWLYNELGVDEIYAHVFSNNERSIRLAKSAGFAISTSYRLFRKDINDETRYEVDVDNEPEGDELGLVRIDIDKERFFEKYYWLVN